jgi:hypothetical protein
MLRSGPDGHTAHLQPEHFARLHEDFFDLLRNQLAVDIKFVARESFTQNALGSTDFTPNAARFRSLPRTSLTITCEETAKAISSPIPCKPPSCLTLQQSALSRPCRVRYTCVVQQHSEQGFRAAGRQGRLGSVGLLKTILHENFA